MSCKYVPLSKYDWKFETQHDPYDNIHCKLPWNPTVYGVIGAFFGSTLWMCLEITVQLFFMFKRRTSLYFWSMLLTTWGIAAITTGFIWSLFTNINPYGVQTLIAFGWVGMVTGFSLVLYSRLHLILYNRKVLRAVLIIIIVDGIIVHIPGIVAGYMPTLAGKSVYHYASRLEIIFSVQEIGLSTLYIDVFKTFMKECRPGPKSQTTYRLLVIAQLTITVCDVAICVLLYCNLPLARLIVLSFVYVVKLKIEFVVLTRLVNFSKASGKGSVSAGSDTSAMLGIDPSTVFGSTITSPPPSHNASVAYQTRTTSRSDTARSSTTYVEKPRRFSLFDAKSLSFRHPNSPHFQQPSYRPRKSSFARSPSNASEMPDIMIAQDFEVTSDPLVPGTLQTSPTSPPSTSTTPKLQSRSTSQARIEFARTETPRVVAMRRPTLNAMQMPTPAIRKQSYFPDLGALDEMERQYLGRSAGTGTARTSL